MCCTQKRIQRSSLQRVTDALISWLLLLDESMAGEMWHPLHNTHTHNNTYTTHIHTTTHTFTHTHTEFYPYSQQFSMHGVSLPGQGVIHLVDTSRLSEWLFTSADELHYTNVVLPRSPPVGLTFSCFSVCVAMRISVRVHVYVCVFVCIYLVMRFFCLGANLCI